MIFYAGVNKTKACLKHANFLKVNSEVTSQQPTNHEDMLLIGKANETTNVLTATTLIYATGAGITAAAGTRLALQ